MTTKQNVGIMIDIETLDLTPKAVVTQIAVVAFDLDDPETIIREIEEYLPIQPQFNLRRTVNASTILWWMDQDEAARKRLKASAGDDFDELVALVNSVNRKLNQVIEAADTVEVWARGPQFDIVTLESLFSDLGQMAPWRYDSVRDLRTALALAGVAKGDVPMRAGLVAHHALSDCRHQIDCLMEAQRRMRAQR